MKHLPQAHVFEHGGGVTLVVSGIICIESPQSVVLFWLFVGPLGYIRPTC